MMSLSLAAAVLLLGPQAPPVPAADTAAPDVRTVTITVTDEKGRPVESLAPEEVAVLENGAARTLSKVEKERRPLRLALIVDTSEPMRDHYRLQILDPLLKFLGQLPEGSEFAVWTTGDRPTKVVDYQAGRVAATKALQRTFPTGGNTVLDALVEASKDLAAKEADRAAIVVVTGTGTGFKNYSKEQVVDIVKGVGATVLGAEIEEAGMDASRAAGEVTQTDYDYVLGNLADATGGRREVLLSSMGVPNALDSFAGELSGQYRLTFETDGGLRDKDRKVEVKVARPGAKVRVAAPRS